LRPRDDGAEVGTVAAAKVLLPGLSAPAPVAGAATDGPDKPDHDDREHYGEEAYFAASLLDGASCLEATAAEHSIEATAAECGIDPEVLEAFYDLFARTERMMTVYPQGVAQSVVSTDKVNAIINCHPTAGRIGRIKALWIVATNPAPSLPPACRIREALAAWPFVVVSDC
jgi:anaerobic selenocysteine-containing dehydrogenase